MTFRKRKRTIIEFLLLYVFYNRHNLLVSYRENDSSLSRSQVQQACSILLPVLCPLITGVIAYIQESELNLSPLQEKYRSRLRIELRPILMHSLFPYPR